MTSNQYAVIGNPVEHSLSPDIHRAFAKQLGIQLSYDKLYSEVSAFDQTVEQFRASGGQGLNVTAPFKGDAFRFSTWLNEAAISAKAVNTLHFQDSEVRGFNTDGIGLVGDLRRLSWIIKDMSVLIIGAGGATQGILQPLLKGGANITVANRTYSRAVSLQESFPEIQVASLDELDSGWSIVINATATGWQNQELPIELNVLQDARCYDLAYAKNGETTFTNQAKKTASELSDGLGMLVEQAAESFRIWHGIQPSTQPILRELRKPKTRFIAGAVCPRCQKQDTLFIELDLLGTPVRRSCHSCDFSDDQDGNVSVTLQ